MLKSIERRFEKLIDQEEPVPLSKKSDTFIEITLSSLEDMILYLLDIVSTINIFIQIYSPLVNNLKTENFIIQ